MAHWKHSATRCAVEHCDSTRIKGWSTCKYHRAYGKQLAGAGRIEPIVVWPRDELVHPIDLVERMADEL